MNIKKLDGSFNIMVNGMPYNTIEGDKYYQQTLDLYNSKPELFEIEKKIEKTLEDLKQEKIAQLKNNCQNYIYSVYPIYKQLDIINPLSDYPIEKKEEMNIFIDKNRNICKEKEELIKKARTQKKVEEINIEFPEKE